MFVVSFLQKVLATCDFRSFQRTVRVNPFPPLVWIDGEALGIAWKQFVVDMKTAEDEKLTETKEPRAKILNDEVFWEEITSANLTTCNATQWKEPFKEEQLYPVNIAENLTVNQGHHQVPKQTIDMENRAKDVSVVGSQSQYLLLQSGVYFLLGALLSTLFWKRRNTHTKSNASFLPPAEAASIAPQTVRQKLANLEQRMALLEAHEKIAHLQSQLQQQQQQSNYNKDNPIPTLVRNSSSNSHTLASSSNHEEALLTDRMLAATVTQDDDDDDISSNNPNYSYEEDEAEQEVGLMLEDFQSELEHIQENLRTGNFLLSPTVHDETVQRGVRYQ